MTPEPTPAQALAAYASAHADLGSLLADAGRGAGAGLRHRADPDGWTVAEILLHLADTEFTHGVRLRRMLTEVSPLWEMWDEKDYLQRMNYAQRDPADAVALVVAARTLNLRLLETLTPQDWARTGVHPHYGDVDVARHLELGNGHIRDHVAQAREVLATL